MPFSPSHRSISRHYEPRLRRCGLSLIELMVCVMIVGILTAIGFGSVRKMRTQAHQAQCLSNLRNLGAASLLWAQENDNILPNPTPQSNLRWNGYIVWDAPGGNRQWTGLGRLFEFGYISDGHTFYCPTARIGEYDYNSQWRTKVNGINNVSGGFRIGYQQRVSSAPLSLIDGANHILATDLFAGEYSQHGNRSINIVYMDGHVRTETNSRRWGAEITNGLYTDWEKNP